ncbi:hypothetical protein EVAR_45746_1 [Eumeta japonica]|uniref:Uncharacterized protein n=1 Tax=Eumeta variegata TaxID=151549 RepID=A0A4C1YMH1_EUMVA|nr:hypothetical protein EVAR_45746_1 [Eumeta japonica]
MSRLATLRDAAGVETATVVLRSFGNRQCDRACLYFDLLREEESFMNCVAARDNLPLGVLIEVAGHRWSQMPQGHRDLEGDIYVSQLSSVSRHRRLMT